MQVVRHAGCYACASSDWLHGDTAFAHLFLSLWKQRKANESVSKAGGGTAFGEEPQGFAGLK